MSLSESLFVRERGLTSHQDLLSWNPITASKLSLETRLVGHRGCVNRLAWNYTEGGTWLASASDDTDVRLWPFTISFADEAIKTSSLVVSTEHESNIFGLQFLPYSKSSSIVTGSMDGTVQWHRLDTVPSPSEFLLRTRKKNRSVVHSRPLLHRIHSREPDDSENHAYGGHGEDDHADEEDAFSSENESGGSNGDEEEPIFEEKINSSSVVYRCHSSRVKYVEVSPRSPDLFWSAGEDGSVRQYDIRMNTSSMDDYESPNVLLTATSRKYKSRRLELKSISVNPISDYLMAVAALEPAVRVYDRRKLSVQNPGGALAAARCSEGLVLRLTPPYFAVAPSGGGFSGSSDGDERRKWWGEVYPTHVTFGNHGDKILASFHQADAYLFDISRSSVQMKCNESLKSPHDRSHELSVELSVESDSTPTVRLKVSENNKQQLDKCTKSIQNLDFYKDPNVRMPVYSQNVSETQLEYLSLKNGGINQGGNSTEPVESITPAGKDALQDGLRLLQDKEFHKAVCRLTDGIKENPHSMELLSKRAEALISRGWVGDAADALSDIETALYLNNYMSFLLWLRRGQILRQCGMIKSASVIAQFCRHCIVQNEEMKINSFTASSGTGNQMEPMKKTPDDSAVEQCMHTSDLQGISNDSNCSEKEHDKLLGQSLSERNSNNKRSFDSFSGNDKLIQGPKIQMPKDTYSLAVYLQEVKQLEKNLELELGKAEKDAEKRHAKANTRREAARRREFSADPRLQANSNSASSQDEEESMLLDTEGEDSYEVLDSQPEGLYKLDTEFAMALEKGLAAIDHSFLDHIPKRKEGTSRSHNWEADHEDTCKRVVLDDKFTKNQPLLWGALPSSKRLLGRFAGQCNQHTDIKEAVFLGDRDSLIACGSDDGSVFIFDANTPQRIVRVLTYADSDVVNSIRSHPVLPVLATSGIESAAKVWSPQKFCSSSEEEVFETANSCQETLRQITRFNPSFADISLLQALLQRNPELLRNRLDTLMREQREDRNSDEETQGSSEQDEQNGSLEIQCRQS